MSGFVALVSTTGAPIDQGHIHRLTDALAFRGPDGIRTWLGPHAAFGHAMFRTNDDPRPEQQPCSLDDKIWIAGDIRVDAREELVAALAQAGQGASLTSTDPELILHAYRAWGPSLVDRLIGDFSFAIWDEQARRLICVRDQLGVKPLFYADAGEFLLVSNTLSCLCSYGALGDALDEAAIGDFLLFGFNADPETTTYRDIKRLPAGSMLSWSPGTKPSVGRYWDLPSHDELRLPRREEYVERFDQLLHAAIKDRVRGDRVAVHMSGGIDSSMIAAHAKLVLAQRNTPFALSAHTIVFDRLIPDRERYYAGLVGAALDIPVHYLAADDYGIFGDTKQLPGTGAEPLDDLARSQFLHDFAQQVAATSRVVLTGWDGDALLASSPSAYLSGLLRSGNFRQFASDALQFARAKQHPLAAIARRLPRLWRLKQEEGAAVSGYPAWLNPDLEGRFNLRRRWDETRSSPAHDGFARTSAYRALRHNNWLRLLESHDAGVTGVPTDCRHPLLDLRVIAFLLSLPAVPWCVDKHVFRASARKLLPREVVRRPKTGLAGDPYAGMTADFLSHFAPQTEPDAPLSRYVDGKRLRAAIDLDGTQQYWMNLRPAMLQKWLCDRPRSDE